MQIAMNTQLLSYYEAIEKASAEMLDAARIGKILAKAKKQAKKDGGKSLEQPAGGLGSSSALTTPQTTP